MNNSTNIISQTRLQHKKNSLLSPFGILLEILFVFVLIGVYILILSYFKVFNLPSLPFTHLATNTLQSQNTAKKIMIDQIDHILVPQYINRNNINTAQFFPDAQKNIYMLSWYPSGPNLKAHVSIKAVSKIYNPTSIDTTIRLGVTDTQLTQLTKTGVQKIITSNFIDYSSSAVVTCASNNCTTTTITDNQKIEIKIYRVEGIPNQVFYLYCAVNKKSPLYNTPTYCLL